MKINPDNDQEESGQLTIADDPIRYHFFYQILDGDDKGRPPRRRKWLGTASPAQALVNKRMFLINKDFNLRSKSCLQALCQSEHKVFNILLLYSIFRTRIYCRTLCLELCLNAVISETKESTFDRILICNK